MPTRQVIETILAKDADGRIITLDFGGFYITQVYTPNAGEGLRRLKERQIWDGKYAEYLQKLDGEKLVIATGVYSWWAQRVKTSKINNSEMLDSGVRQDHTPILLEVDL